MLWRVLHLQLNAQSRSRSFTSTHNSLYRTNPLFPPKESNPTTCLQGGDWKYLATSINHTVCLPGSLSNYFAIVSCREGEKVKGRRAHPAGCLGPPKSKYFPPLCSDFPSLGTALEVKLVCPRTLRVSLNVFHITSDCTPVIPLWHNSCPRRACPIFGQENPWCVRCVP